MTLNDQLTNQNRIKMEQKTAYEKLFVEKCAEFAKEIERYSGTDQLDPWYRYLVWLEENYVIDFSAESIFMDILCRCLATFEADERYKQDRRMIKLFIKYVRKNVVVHRSKTDQLIWCVLLLSDKLSKRTRRTFQFNVLEWDWYARFRFVRMLGTLVQYCRQF